MNVLTTKKKKKDQQMLQSYRRDRFVSKTCSHATALQWLLLHHQEFLSLQQKREIMSGRP
jgi:hypothetical protein